MTDRPTFPDDIGGRKMPNPSPFAEFKGGGSYGYPVGSHDGGGAEPSGKRISHRRLEEIIPALSGRDREILTALRHCRYLLTRQIQRLFFTDAATQPAGLKATNRNLNKLHGLSLISALPRRIGGVRSGSGSKIWFLTQAGERLLRIGDTDVHVRKRFFEPSSHFLGHTLCVAECYVQLTEICSRGGMKLDAVQMETHCWRSYHYKGKLTTLRPDLFAITHSGEYEDRWFIEVDLDTEAPVTVVEKCRRYHHYYQSGLEQKQHEVFPLVVWIVPDEARRGSLTNHIRAEFIRHPKIFIVITPDELEPLFRQGVERGRLC